MAVRLAKVYGIGRTAQVSARLRRLKAQAEGVDENSQSGGPAFLELPSAIVARAACSSSTTARDHPARATGGYDTADLEALARSFWAPMMLQITPHMRILVASSRLIFAGIDSLARLCRESSGRTVRRRCVRLPQSQGHGAEGARVRRPGFWLCHKRLSQGRFPWWPSTPEKGAGRLVAHQLAVLLAAGDPTRTGAPADWRPVGPLSDRPHLTSRPSLRPEFALVGLLDRCLTDARPRGKTGNPPPGTWRVPSAGSFDRLLQDATRTRDHRSGRRRLEDVLHRVEQALDEQDSQLVRAVFAAYAYVVDLVEDKNTTIRRLRQWSSGHARRRPRTWSTQPGDVRSSSASGTAVDASIAPAEACGDGLIQPSRAERASQRRHAVTGATAPMPMRLPFGSRCRTRRCRLATRVLSAMRARSTRSRPA